MTTSANPCAPEFHEGMRHNPVQWRLWTKLPYLDEHAGFTVEYAYCRRCDEKLSRPLGLSNKAAS